MGSEVTAGEVRVKRIYDEPTEDDGCRVFADRLWARGVKKDAARIDLWPKELTPSTALRKWFHEDPSRQELFAVRYRDELDEHRAEAVQLLRQVDQPVITLITATKDLTHGHAGILKSFLDELLVEESP